MSRYIINPWLYPPFVPLPPSGFLPYPVSSAVNTPTEIEIRPKGCTSLSTNSVRVVLPRDLMLCAGIMQSPATSPLDYRSWAFLLEHAASLGHTSNKLRIVDSSSTWDTRVKGLFGERFGMGLAAWTLWRHFNVVHIADAGQFVGTVRAGRGTPFARKGLARRGSSLSTPDFLCIDRSSLAVIAESKGTIGAPGDIPKSERKKAKDQTKSVTLVGARLRPTDARLAFCTNIRSESDTARKWKDTGTLVTDPEGDDDATPLEVSPDDITIDSYAKFFQFAGVGLLAYAMQLGFRPLIPDVRDLDAGAGAPVEKLLGERVFVMAEIFGMRLGLLERVANELLNQPKEGVTERIAEVLVESVAWRNLDEEDLPLGTLILPNGIVGLSGR